MNTWSRISKKWKWIKMLWSSRRLNNLCLTNDHVIMSSTSASEVNIKRVLDYKIVARESTISHTIRHPTTRSKTL